LTIADGLSQPGSALSMTRIFIVHAHPLTRLGVAHALTGAPGLELMRQTASSTEARRVLPTLNPDAITIDATLPEGDGIEAAVALRALKPGLAVVVLGPPRDRQLVLRTLEAGLSAYLPETANPDELVAVLRHSAASMNTFSSRLLAAALRGGRRGQSTALSVRERQVHQLVREGLSLSAIATRLLLSESTVKTYVGRIQTKLRVTNLAGLRAQPIALMPADRPSPA
jgi:DNA-binding NarL/FixJ family response regulator